MKRLICSILATVVILTCAVGCAPANNAILRVSDGAFNMTPQEYINMVNTAIEEQGDSRYKTIPDFVESGEELEICWLNFTLALSTNDAGYITEFEFDWKLGSDNVNKTVPFVLGFTLGCICPGDAGDAVWAKLDMMDSMSPKYSTTATSNGVTFDYGCFGNGVYSDLTIYPAE